MQKVFKVIILDNFVAILQDLAASWRGDIKNKKVIKMVKNGKILKSLDVQVMNMGELGFRLLVRKKDEFKGEEGRAFRNITPSIFGKKLPFLGRELFVERSMRKVERALLKEATLSLGGHRILPPEWIERYDLITQERFNALCESGGDVYTTRYRDVMERLYYSRLDRIAKGIRRFDPMTAEFGLIGHIAMTAFCGVFTFLVSSIPLAALRVMDAVGNDYAQPVAITLLKGGAALGALAIGGVITLALGGATVVSLIPFYKKIMDWSGYSEYRRTDKARGIFTRTAIEESLQTASIPQTASATS